MRVSPGRVFAAIVVTFFFFVSLLFVVQISGVIDPPLDEYNKTTILVETPNNQTECIEVHLAETDRQKRAGLSNRNQIEPMLFINKQETDTTITTRGVRQKFDIVFFDKSKTATRVVHSATPHGPYVRLIEGTTYTESETKYVLELPNGTAESLSIRENATQFRFANCPSATESS